MGYVLLAAVSCQASKTDVYVLLEPLKRQLRQHFEEGTNFPRVFQAGRKEPGIHSNTDEMVRSWSFVHRAYQSKVLSAKANAIHLCFM